MNTVSVFPVVAVALGGALGAVCRTLAGKYVQHAGFPVGTLLVNVIGSFLMGIAYYWVSDRMSHWLVGRELFRSVVMSGFLGALTTFSTFSLDTFLLITEGYFFRAVSYVLLSTLLCIFAVWVGHGSAQILTGYLR